MKRLAHQLLGQACNQYDRRMHFSASALRAIFAYRWPGNVRELENVVSKAVLHAKGRVLQLAHLKLPATRCCSDFVSEAEYFFKVVRTMEAHHSEQEIADKLGISRQALYQRRLKYGLVRPGAPTHSADN